MLVGIVKNVPQHVVRLNEKKNLHDICFWLENKIVNSNKINVTLKYTTNTTSSKILNFLELNFYVTVYMLKYFRSNTSHQTGYSCIRAT